MGCAQSRIENEEVVMRCKERRNFMKEAVSERNVFAASHSAYAVALKNIGAGLSDYGHGEAEIQKQEIHHHPEEASLGSVETTPMDPSTIKPPPPPPNFSPSPLQRHMSMPDFPQKQPNRKNLDPIILTIPEDDKEAKGTFEQNLKQGSKASPPKTPPTQPLQKSMTWDYFFSVEEMERGSFDKNEEDDDDDDDDDDDEDLEDPKDDGGGGGGDDVGGQIDVVIEQKTPERTDEKVEETPPPINKKPREKSDFSNAVCGSNLLQILTQLDDHFLKASESAQDVSKLLEANRLHFHSNFADNGGHMDHSAKVMRVITWNRSSKGNGGGHDDSDLDTETHATVLDKLLAWEKKLYNEVKAGEMMKSEYSRKIRVLSKQKKRGVSAESLEKTKAAVSHLHTRYIVDMQSLDSTVAEVNHLRDNHLYCKLVSLVEELAKMWENMLVHHRSQLKVALDLKSVDTSQSPKETTKQHHLQTIQLMKIVEQWQSQFEKMVTHQKRYIRSLHSWLKMNLIPIECAPVTTPKPQTIVKTPPPKIHALLTAWQDLLQNPQDDLTKSAIASFVAVMKTIVDYQVEEMKLKEKCEETRKEYQRKERSFEEWHEKYLRRKSNPHEEGEEEKTRRAGEEDRVTGGAENLDLNLKDPVLEKQFVVATLRKRLEEEEGEHRRHCIQVRDKSLGCLKIRLPELFRAMWDYTHSASHIYKELRTIANAMSNQETPVPS